MINARKEDLRAQIARAEKKLRQLEELPDFETLADGTVMALILTLGPSRPYTYVAFKTAGKWYLTGSNSPNGVSSEGLADWLTTQGRRLKAAMVVAEIQVETVDLGALLNSLQDNPPYAGMSPAEEAALYRHAPDHVVNDYESRKFR